ncbi:MAG TPA: 3-methyl-2-oxobutanoate hydroxymethyltransferase [Actinomycetota bacterium]|jgi:3-methyl-2-oxobutanoate hydroxymethyltransferase|nr:3-methyl-2-oxobutanoate hydroxymethyltransferase [Actinomycetota bacterium]
MSVSIHHLREWKARGQKFVMVTAYDALSARILDEAGIPLLLVGDSVSNVLLGYPTTLQVTIDDMLHHARAVARGARDALLVGDLPWGSYQSSTEDAVTNATAFLRVGMHAVKLEGAGPAIEVVRALTERGIPTMGHLGLTPQFVNAIGGFKVQGRGSAGDVLVDNAKRLEDAGAFAVVLECVPSDVGRRATEALEIPTIGIGAGPDTSAQVLVLHDLLGMTPGPSPRFVKRYADLATQVTQAVQMFAKEVAEGVYPAPEHEYS